MKLLTIKQLSAMINIKESTLYSWSARKMIPSHKLNGLLRFEFTEIEDWIKDSKIVLKTSKLPKKIAKKIDNNKIDTIIKETIESLKYQSYNNCDTRKIKPLKPEGRR